MLMCIVCKRTQDSPRLERSLTLTKCLAIFINDLEEKSSTVQYVTLCYILYYSSGASRSQPLSVYLLYRYLIVYVVM